MDDEYYDGLKRVNPGYGKPKFSRRELLDILVAVVVLSVAFTVLYRKGSILEFFEIKLGSGLEYVGLFGLCLVLVTISFLFHEFGHKFVAQKHGLWSEFRMWPLGLALTLITPLIGFLFASPGAVYIAGDMDSDTNGKVSIAGPIVNIVFCAIGILGWIAFNGTDFIVFFMLLANLNAFLALFNLLPIPPLDGSKVITWNLGIWIVAIGIAVAELACLMFCMPEAYYMV